MRFPYIYFLFTLFSKKRHWFCRVFLPIDMEQHNLSASNLFCNCVHFAAFFCILANNSNVWRICRDLCREKDSACKSFNTDTHKKVSKKQWRFLYIIVDRRLRQFFNGNPWNFNLKLHYSSTFSSYTFFVVILLLFKFRQILDVYLTQNIESVRKKCQWISVKFVG